MSEFLRRTWAEVDLDAIKYNFLKIKEKLLPGTKLMCVVKADAYGHGSKYLARELCNLGADRFAVSNAEEAMELRNYGIKKPILVLGYTPVSAVETLFKYDIDQAVLSEEYADSLIDACKKKGVKIKVHIKIDTGMNRIGFPAKNQTETESTAKKIKCISKNKEFILEGVFTHFSVADDPDNGAEYTRSQFDNFMSLINLSESYGVEIPLKHCSNSGAVIDYPDMNPDMVRAGIILYGLYPSKDLKDKIDLRPAMKLKTVVSQLKNVPKGSSVSYGRTFTAPGDIKIATVPIGYADGYSRRLSNNAEMLVCGKRAPVIGRVCMDQLMLDVTGIDGVKEGSQVTVFGFDGEAGISADELADLSGTVNYEIICLIGRRVPRIYCRQGKEIGRSNYMNY